MKYSYLVAGALVAGLTSCEKDNFEPPKLVFEGRLVYKGEPLLVQSANTGSNSDFPVFFELWQRAYNNRTPSSRMAHSRPCSSMESTS